DAAALEAAHYASCDGATIDLVRAAKSGDVLLHVHDPGVVEMKLVVPREPAAQPREMMAETSFGELPLTLVGVGADLYGTVNADGRKVEFVVGGDGKPRMAVD